MADTNTTPQDRIRIFDNDGFPVAEFRTSAQRSWMLADEGRALFTYASRKTNIVNERVLQFGNWLLIENDTILPWVGVIDTPRKWTARNVSVYAYTPERVFKQRRGPIEEILTGSAGTIFEQILNYVNQAEVTILRVGTIYRGGEQRQETVNPKPLNENLAQLQQRSGEEYQWRPFVDANGRLVVYADWTPRLGVDTSALLHEGKGGGNVETVDNILVEDGPIVNDILAYGDGETWNSKPTQIVQDAASIGKYGLRQASKQYSGVTNVQTLYTNGATYISQHKNPVRSFRLNAINVGTTFKYLQLGNRLKLRFENVGFYQGAAGLETTIRIMGMAYDPDDKGVMNLVVEETFSG